MHTATRVDFHRSLPSIRRKAIASNGLDQRLISPTLAATPRAGNDELPGRRGQHRRADHRVLRDVRYHQTMGSSHISGNTARIIIVLLAFSLVGILTAYGWLVALNVVIPLITAVLWVCVVALAAWGAGVPLARWALPTVDDTLWRVFFALIGGLGVLMASSAVLALLHLLRPPAVLGVLALWACLGALRLHRSRSSAMTADRQGIHPLVMLLVAAGGLSLAAATTFAPFYDQWHYHLAFPYQWLRWGTVITFDRHAYSFFPSNMGLLYVYALAGPGGWAAQIMHWMMGILAAAGSALLAGRLGAPRIGSLLAAVIVLATPSVIQMGALAGSDLGVAAFAVAAVLTLFADRSNPTVNSRKTIIAGVFTGMAVGCKYLALATIAVPLLIVTAALSASAARPKHRLRAGVVAALIFGIGMALVASPWFVRNTIATGNPTYPYFESVFHTSPADEGIATGIGDFGLSREKIGVALTLGTFARRGQSSDIGPVYLWLSPLVLIWAWRHRGRPEVAAMVALIVGGILCWSAGPPLGRYLLPTLALLAACIGASWTELLGALAPIPRVLCTGVLAAVLVANCNPTRAEYLPDQLACFAGTTPYEAYLEANLTQLEAVRAANATLPDKALLLLVGEPRVYGLDRAFVVEDAFHKPLLVEFAEESKSPAEIAARLRGFGVTHLLINHAEARRIAVAEGRDRYLECADAEAETRLGRFLNVHTHPRVAGPWWEIVALLPASP